ncbi:ribonuclease P protein component [Spiroplasma endosymbiont of Nebria brevicollis]|uniref:ribonuclease P protein component n=1 Tax=Spiroplasma endosymbiont of Nebria brevicollis TaxID=3066284 RepID=UPI00313C67DB
MEKKYHLLKNHHFKYLINEGKSLSNSQFYIYYINRSDFGTIKIGISVGKKLVRFAFERNKIKRQVRSMLIDVKKDWPVDMVIMVRKNYLSNTYEKNTSSLLNLLMKVPLKGV